MSHSCSFSTAIKTIQEAVPLWHLSTHEFFAHKFGASIRCCRSFLFLSSTAVPVTSLFPPSSDVLFTCTLPWLSPVFNKPPFSLFITANLSPLNQSPTFCQPLNEPRIYAFTKQNNSTPFSSQNEIYYLTHPVPEPDFTSSASPFDGWFGILFPSPLSFTHVRAPHPTEILNLYEFSILISLYPTILSSFQIFSLVLYIIPLPLMNHLSRDFLSHIVPPIIPSSIQTKCVRVNTQCIGHCFTFQSLPASDQWISAYNDDPHTKVLLDRLSTSTPLDKPTILHLLTVYRTTIVPNLLGILEDRLVYYEKIATVTNHICRNVVSNSLRRIIFNLMHATPIAGHMG